MNNKIRNQVLIGGLIIVIGIAIYFSGITSTQEDECEVVGRQGGNAAGAGTVSYTHLTLLTTPYV